jgi:hypothetical protein
MNSHRCVLEVFAFLPPERVAVVALVCRQWSCIASEDELWQDHADAQSMDLTLIPGNTKKERFWEAVFSAFSLPILTAKQLVWFNITTKKWKCYAILDPIHVDFSSFIVHVKNGIVLAFGNSKSDYNKSVYKVFFGKVEQLANMDSGRKSPGAVLYDKYVYVFGGVNNLTCEKLSLDTESWAPLSPLPTNLSEITPIVHLTDIYLCAGLCYRYSTVNDRYDSLPNSKGCRGFALLIDKSITILTSHSIVLISLERSKVEEKAFPSWGYGGICTQGLHHNQSIWVTFNTAVMQLDLTSLSTTIHER